MSVRLLGGAGNALSPREFVVRLVLAEALAKPGEGPLAPRFGRRPQSAGAPSPETPEGAGGSEPA